MSLRSIANAITTTGIGNGVSFAIQKKAPDKQFLVGVRGTYGTAVLVAVGYLVEGGTPYIIPLVRMSDQTKITGGSFAPSDNSSTLYGGICSNFVRVTIYASSLGSGTPYIDFSSGRFFEGAVLWGDNSVTVASTPQAISSANANALAVGPNGTTNPTFQVDAATGSAATGLKVTGAAAAGRVALAVISSGTNEGFDIDAKGSGTIRLGNTSTGNIVLGRDATGVSLAVTAGLTSSGATGAGIGYATGAGGTVTQASSITTGVTLNKLTGTITTVSSTLAAGVDATFTVTNSTVAATDTIVINTKSYAGTADGIPICKVQSVGAGSFVVNVHNQGAVALDAAIVMSFAVLKGVAA